MIFVDLSRRGDSLSLYISETSATDAGWRYLLPDGHWSETLPEGTDFPSPPTLRIEGRIIGAVLPKLRDELDRYYGRTPAATEAAVLREVLTLEQARVDRVLARGDH